MTDEIRIHQYGIQIALHQYPEVQACGIQYGYQIEQGLFVHNVGLMVLCSSDETEIIDFDVNVVYEGKNWIRQKPIPPALRTDASEDSTNIPDERLEPIRQ